MPLKSLGNVVPTDDERKKMVEVLEGLRQRLNSREGSDFAPPVYNEADDTVELRWASGGRGWISAWIDGLCRGRMLLVWRHPTYRYSADETYIYENSKTRNATSL